MSASKMNEAEVEAFLKKHFPQARVPGLSVEKIDSGHATLRLAVSERYLRPGGTVSGPTMMLLADTAAYFAILGALGPVAMAVTSNLNISFLRKPDSTDLITEAELIHLGRRSAVATVRLRNDHVETEVAHATVTYALPSPS